jgi:hypothetical protein
MSKIAIYMSGNYAEILRHLPDFMGEYDFIGFCQNFNSFEIIKRTSSFKHNFYLYDSFNSRYDELDFDALREQVPFNLFATSVRDKAHFNRLAGRAQEKILLTMYAIIDEWFEKTNPKMIIIPIIESIDSMMVYDIAKSRRVETLCYGHARQLNRSYFSDSHLELLPIFTKNIKTEIEHEKSAKEFLSVYQNAPDEMNYAKQIENLYSNFEIKEQLAYHQVRNLFFRILRSVKLKFTKESKNQLNLFYIKILVTIERIVLPIQKYIYLAFEKLYLKPLKNLPEKFDYFPLHFSPESSINTPAPFYIDQIRVVDEIMLNRNSNNILLVKEHPAMYLKRNLTFYKTLKKKPLVRFISKKFNSLELIQKADCTYSVTGTACMEAFLLNKKWKMLGSNFLSEFLKDHPKGSPIDFIAAIYKGSAEFVLYSPPLKDGVRKKALFAKQNLINMSNYLRFYFENINPKKT